jgi:hypothetical protein
MRYIKVKWTHNLDNEPCLLYSELDEDLWEKRKVEVFADGSAAFASEDECFGDTGLSIEPLPSLEEIGSDPQFDPEPISAAEFEEVWKSAVEGSRLR